MSLNYERIGKAQGALLRWRQIHSRRIDGRSMRDGEADAALAIDDLSPAEFEALRGMFDAMGYEMRVIRDGEGYPGIPPGGFVALLFPNRDHGTLSPFGADRVWHELAAGTEPKGATAVWFGFLWLLVLSLLYERHGRPLSAVSDYISPVFTRKDLEDKANECIEEMRGSGAEANSDELPVAAYILAPPGGRTRAVDVRARIGRFLPLLVDCQVLEIIRHDQDEDVYRQTLLSAMQLNELYSLDLMHFVPKDGIADELRSILPRRTAETTANTVDDTTGGHADGADE